MQARNQEKLKEIIVSINGQDKHFYHEETIKVYHGDKVLIRSAELLTGRGPEFINIVGYRQKGVDRSFDDAKRLIEIPKGLKPKWSLHKSGKTYRINVMTKSELHGWVFLEVIEPEISSISFNNNEGLQVVSPGQTIYVRSLSQLRLKKVTANFDVTDKNFRFLVDSRQGVKRLVLSRYNHKVAVFPIEVQKNSHVEY